MSVSGATIVPLFAVPPPVATLAGKVRANIRKIAKPPPPPARAPDPQPDQSTARRAATGLLDKLV